MSHKINEIKLGLALGITIGGYLFFFAFMVNFFDWGTELLEVISSLYIGYKGTYTGSLIGFAWGFADFFVIGYAIAWLYNNLKIMEEEE